MVFSRKNYIGYKKVGGSVDEGVTNVNTWWENILSESKLTSAVNTRDHYGGGVSNRTDTSPAKIQADTEPPIPANLELHFVFIGCGPNALIAAMLLSTKLRSLEINYRIILTQPERHSSLTRTFGVLSGFVKWLEDSIDEDFKTVGRCLREIIPNDQGFNNTQTCAGLQEHLLRELATDKHNVFVKLYEQKKNEDLYYEDDLRPNSIICDFTGGRHTWINEHKEQTLTEGADIFKSTDAWISSRTKPPDQYYGIGNFHIRSSETDTGKEKYWGKTMTAPIHTNTYYQNKPIQVWHSYDIEITKKCPAVNLKNERVHFERVHLLCGSGLIKTDAYFHSLTLFFGGLTSLGILHTYLQGSSKTKKKSIF